MTTSDRYTRLAPAIAVALLAATVAAVLLPQSGSTRRSTPHYTQATYLRAIAQGFATAHADGLSVREHKQQILDNGTLLVDLLMPDANNPDGLAPGGEPFAALEGTWVFWGETYIDDDPAVWNFEHDVVAVVLEFSNGRWGMATSMGVAEFDVEPAAVLERMRAERLETDLSPVPDDLVRALSRDN